MLLDDPRFAFIAKTEEEWAGFRLADVVVSRNAKTGEFSVVFGREHVERARNDGGRKVRALVVPCNPETDELERLTAACLVLKGAPRPASQGLSMITKSGQADRERHRN